MARRRILIVGNYPPPYGGVPHHIERVSAYLAARGWSCSVLSGGVSGTHRVGDVTVYKPSYSHKARVWMSQWGEHRLHPWLGPDTFDQDEKAIWRRYNIFCEIGERIVRENRIDIVASYNLLMYGPIGAWLSHRFRIPHVMTIFGEIYKFPAIKRNRRFFGKVAQGAHRVLSCSEHCGRSLRELDLARDATAVTYGINTEHFRPGDAGQLRERLGVGAAPVILFVGRLGREMGLDSFMAAARICAAQHPDTRFVMAGQQDDLANEIERECAASGGRMVLTRNVPYDELANYYRIADLVVVPTRGSRTCSSLAAMEAMATRKPVVGFAVGGIPEIVEHERTGLLVAPEDTAALAAAITRLLQDTALRDSLAEAGYSQASARFDERLVNEAMERHLEVALSHHES